MPREEERADRLGRSLDNAVEEIAALRAKNSELENTILLMKQSAANHAEIITTLTQLIEVVKYHMKQNTDAIQRLNSTFAVEREPL